MKFYTVDVMIPTYKPGQEFAELLPRLLEQTYPIRSIRVVNTGKKFWNPAWEQLSDKIMVEHIRPSEFDHGGTRRAMAESSDHSGNHREQKRTKCVFKSYHYYSLKFYLILSTLKIYLQR